MADYLPREGIRLDPAKVEKNPGRKAVTKLMLNSFWGKFAKRLNKCQAEQVTTPARLYQLLRDESIDIHAVRVINDDILDVTYNYIVEVVAKNPRTGDLQVVAGANRDRVRKPSGRNDGRARGS